MKIVIIGGGIAGLTLAGFLQKQGVEFVVNERNPTLPTRGNSFLMHTEGYAIIDSLSQNSLNYCLGEEIDTFRLYKPNGEEVIQTNIEPWRCMRRSDLINHLFELIKDKSTLKFNRSFSRFIYENGKIIAVEFKNGEIEYGDIFVGADGGNSPIREAIHGPTAYTPVNVKEILGNVRDKEIIKRYSGVFTKYQSDKEGLSFGFIPTHHDELVWYIQFDTSRNDITEYTPEELEAFTKGLVKEFPQVVQDILAKNDFTQSYVWHTRDFDPLKAFHKDNVVLIGDAAHLALPFTSAGTTNALIDAYVLAQQLENNTTDYQQSFNNLYDLRINTISEQTKLGRDLKKSFLTPNNKKAIEIPLTNVQETSKNLPKVVIKYFTDPICSTCWLSQPVLRKLKLEYGDYLDIQYVMGGLLPSWENYEKGIIKKPSDAARLWNDVSKQFDMPLNGEIWLEDPLHSSFPPSIAFKAAEMQSHEKALAFLRRIQEMIFLEKKNIAKWIYIEEAAEEAGLNTCKLLNDMNGKAKEDFDADLEMVKDYGVNRFPTFILSGENQEEVTIKGVQEYSVFEDAILKFIPNVQKTEITLSPEELFKQFPTMTEKEFAILTDVTPDVAHYLLNQLFNEGIIYKYRSKNGLLWINSVIHRQEHESKEATILNRTSLECDFCYL
ncbi:MAG: DsbA family protein [Flectobacillus sp.]|nr:DsbA family protein [Flectobacillus sp.]